MGSHVIRFCCPVCGGQYSTVQDWLGHLLEDRHQNLSREGLINANGSWDGDEKKRALVVLSNQPVVKEGESRILQYFSNKFYEAVVTDFVWWPERPRVGFLQFDTSEMAKKVMTVQNQRIHVEDQEFRFKEAITVVDFEWDALLPTSTDPRHVEDPSGSKCLSDATVLDSNDNLKRKIKLEKDDVHGSETEVSNTTEEVQQPEVPKRKKRKLTNPNQPSESPAEYLRRQLNLIQTAVKVPDDDYDSIQRLLPRLEELFVDHHKKSGLPVTTALLSRNWSLKLKYNEDDLPYIFVEKTKKTRTKSTKLLSIPISELNTQLSSSEKAKALFFSRTRLFPPDTDTESLDEGLSFLVFSLTGENGAECGNPFPTLKITGTGSRKMESQLWRMVKYLCSFDQWCEPLLAVIYYWAGINSIQLAESNAESSLADDERDLPDPFVITWLAILFLYEKKLLPSPSNILNRSRNLKKPSVIHFKGVNIDFREDTEYSTSWLARMPTLSKGVAEIILTLAAEFFSHWGRTLEKGNWIIDAGCGAVLGMDTIRNSSFLLDGMSKVKLLLEKENYSHRLHLTNPFSYGWKINLSSSEEPYRAMIKTGKKLEEFLQQLRNTGEGGGLGMGDEELLEVLKI